MGKPQGKHGTCCSCALDSRLHAPVSGFLPFWPKVLVNVQELEGGAVHD